MTQDDEDEEEDDLFFGQQSPFHDPSGFEDFFRDFNELFADFGSMIRDVPRLPGVGPPAPHPGGSRSGSVRDFMLKYPDSHLPREQTPPCRDPDPPRWPPAWREDDAGPAPPGDYKQDKILDSEVSSRGLDSILRPEDRSPSPYYRSVSVSKVVRPDGTVEEKRTVRDSEGNTSTTVTVSSGDQVISSGISEPSTDEKDPSMIPHRSLPDLSDSQTIISRILQRWFSK
ncbi:HCLS1-associated protein X-1 isoform X2 [Dendropsophus ebraccatus]